MHKSSGSTTKQQEQAARDIARAYTQVSKSFANAAQVEQYWLEMLRRDEHPGKLERLDRYLLGQPGTGSLYDEVDTIISLFRR